MIVLKLGGSVITEKDSPETVDTRSLNRAATALAGVEDVVLVHGGGSFGHPAANDHDVSRTQGTRDSAAVVDIHDAMRRLNRHVIDALQSEAVAAVPVHPLSLASRDPTGELSLPATVVDRMTSEGFVPVLHGDVIVHVDRGATILSGDELVVELARGLDADRVGLCTTVPGVLDREETVIPRIRSMDEVDGLLGEAGTTDVTGGMAAKVRSLLELETPASIFDLDHLSAFLDGDDPGTLID